MLRSAEKTPTEELSLNNSMDDSLDESVVSINDGAKNAGIDVVEDCSNDAVADVVTDVITDSDDVVCANNQPEISENAMRYLEKLFEKHEQIIKERFSATEKTLMDKINTLEMNIAAKDKAFADLQSHVSQLEEEVKVVQANDEALADLHTHVLKLESEISVVKAANSHLLHQHDDLEQYGRRMNVRFEGIEYDPTEKSDELKAKIENTLKEVGVDIQPDMMVRFHRSGRPYQKNGKTVAQTIMRFTLIHEINTGLN